VKILLDVNLSPSWAAFLVHAGVQAVHWTSVGSPAAPDRELMAWAREHGHVVFTNDLDFSALLALTRDSGPSVLQVRTQDLLPAAIGAVVLRVLRDHGAALEAGAILTVHESGSRVRILPLGSGPDSA